MLEFRILCSPQFGERIAPACNLVLKTSGSERAGDRHLRSPQLVKGTGLDMVILVLTVSTQVCGTCSEGFESHISPSDFFAPF